LVACSGEIVNPVPLASPGSGGAGPSATTATSAGGSGGATSSTSSAVGTSTSAGGAGGAGGRGSIPCTADDPGPCLLASGEQLPWGIASDGTSVYWIDGSTSPSGQLLTDGSVRKCSAAGCGNQPETLVGGLAAPAPIVAGLD